MLRGHAGAHGAGALVVVLSVALAAPAYAVYPPVPTPSAPRNVVAVPGDAEATVAWQAPESAGDTPITGYTVTSSPASAGCTTVPPTLSCTITGLTNGTSYTFSVTATNAAGTGPAGVSNAVTPQQATPTITITASRSGRTITVRGQTTNVPAGASLSSLLRVGGNATFARGGSATARANGSFTWTTSLAASKRVEIYFAYRGVQSNVVVLSGASRSSLSITGSRAGRTATIQGQAPRSWSGTNVTLYRRSLTTGAFVPDGTARVARNGTFTFTRKVAPNRPLTVYVLGRGVRSNTLDFKPLGPALVLSTINLIIQRSTGVTVRGDITGERVTITGQAFGLPRGTVIIPYVSINRGRFIRGTSLRTLDRQGRFSWTQRLGPQAKNVRVYFATVNGLKSNTMRVSR